MKNLKNVNDFVEWYYDEYRERANHMHLVKLGMKEGFF